MESSDNIAAKLAMVLGAKLDAKTKFKLLDMLDERPVVTIDKLDPITNTLTEERMKDLLDGKVDYIISDSFEDMEFLTKCREESVNIASQEGLMKDAGYGRGTEYVKDKKVRGDKFIWLSQIL